MLKKLPLLLIYFTLISLSCRVFSQEYFTFPESNAIWNIKFTNTWEGNDEIRYGQIGDTLIEDIVYHKIYRLKDSTLINPESVFCCGIREESKRIYVKINDLDEQLIYDFNLNVGDSIKYNFSGNFYINDGNIEFYQYGDTFYRKVISIDTLNVFNGSQRRHYVLGRSNGSQSFNDEWIEGMGSCVWFGLFNPYITEVTTNGDGWTPICFKVGDEVVYLENSDCEKCFCKLYTEIIEVDSESHPDYPYPNPANNILVFNFPSKNGNTKNKNTIKILEINGKLLQEIHTESNFFEVNIWDLKEGIYMFETLNNGKVTQTGKFIKN